VYVSEPHEYLCIIKPSFTIGAHLQLASKKGLLHAAVTGTVYKNVCHRLTFVFNTVAVECIDLLLVLGYFSGLNHH